LTGLNYSETDDEHGELSSEGQEVLRDGVTAGHETSNCQPTNWKWFTEEPNMRHSDYRMFCPALAITLITSAASMAGLHAQEFVVNQAVISDTGIEGMSVGGSTVNEAGRVAGQSSYVGDLSASDAGIISGTGGARRAFGQPDLFYNYFTQGYSNRANAQMYLSPLPIPPNVGHTYYTYQPFYPHHMLYAHKDRYHRYYDNGRGMNRTKATYSYPPVKTAISNFYWNKLRLAR
jgi:hypothetical protein